MNDKLAKRLRALAAKRASALNYPMDTRYYKSPRSGSVEVKQKCSRGDYLDLKKEHCRAS